ncbi:MAG: leucine-rich repeat protein [Treponema sp.]|nr:leucine-rich repeat protein [Treponema sp.]
MRNGFSTDNFRKRFFALFIFLSAAFLLSCSHSFERNEERNGTEKSQPCIVKGKISLFGTGAVPAAISKTQTQNGRTALPAPEISSYTHKVTAANGSSTKEAEVSTDESGNIVFSVVLEAGTWTFTAETFDSADSKVFESEGTEKEIGEGDNSVALVLKPLTDTGNGSVKLPVTVDSSIKKMETSSSKTELNAIELDFTSSATGEINVADIESGSYSVAFHFYDESGALVYSFTETVNVYPNLETNSWLNSGKYINSDKEIEITSALISSFQNSAFFVKSSGSPNASGGFFDPFDSITTAATVIANTLAESEYEIFLLDDLSGNQSIDLSAATKSLKISVQGYDSSERTIIPSDKTATTLTINGNAGLEIKFSKILMTVESETADGTSTDGGGISVSGNPKVTLEDCEVSGFVSSGSKGGGGIYNEGTLILLGSTRIYGNDAKTGSGGGIYNEGGTVVLGGSAVVGDKGAEETTTGEYGHYSNHAVKHGGGIYSNGGAVYIGYTDESTEDTGFDGGICYNYTEYQGGGVFSAGNATKIVMSGGAVSYNGSKSEAGGVRISGAEDSFTMSGGAIANNTANMGDTGSCGGGGIYVGGSSTGTDGVLITGGSITGNRAYSGGGIYSTRLVRISGNTEISGNTATGTGSVGYGGGIYLNTTSASTTESGSSETVSKGGRLVMGGSASISNNTAANGGGIAAVGNSEIHIGYTDTGSADSSFSGGIKGNTATASGGGIYAGTDSVTSPEIKMSSGSISQNKTEGTFGAGAAILGSCEFTMYGGEISGNDANGSEATGEGGGVYIDTNATLTMKSGAKISSNTAGKGAEICIDGKLAMEGGEISSSSGISCESFVHQNGELRMGGDAKITCGIYLPSYHYIYIDSALTAESPVATIEPQEYSTVEILREEGTEGLLEANYGKFALADTSGGWYIASDGYMRNDAIAIGSWAELSSAISSGMESSPCDLSVVVKDISDFDGTPITVSGSDEDSVTIAAESADATIKGDSTSGDMFKAWGGTLNIGSGGHTITLGDSSTTKTSGNYLYAGFSTANAENVNFINSTESAVATGSSGETTLKDCTFSSIKSSRGAVYANDGLTTIESCTFTNCADESSGCYDIYIGYNGKIALGGTLYGMTIYSSEKDYNDGRITISPYMTVVDGTITVVISGYNATQKVFVMDDGNEISETTRDFFTVVDTDGNSYSINADGTLSQTVSTTLYVSSSGAETNSGYTEASALPTLQAAVNKISTSDDWTIIVSGTVTGTTTISSISASSLTIKGKTGYSSDILDASGSSSAVIEVDNAVPVTISNLTLQNGEMGLLHSGTESITIESCQIIKNTAGGLFFSSESDSTVKDSTIGGSSANSNTSENGGGITKSGNGTLTIENSTISNNTATSYGGGIYIDGGKVIFSSGSISNNTGSGIYIKSGNATISGGSISNNTYAKGAGIYLSSTTSSLTLTGGSITENSATNNGGGIFMNNGSATISGGSIESNSATYNGGGIYMVNGDFDFTGGNAKSNTANCGNGLYIEGGTFTMSGSAVVDSSNDAYLSSGTYITIGGTLSATTAATITPGNYSTGTQVLKDGDGTVADNYAKFSVTTDPSGQAWTVNSSGYLSENSSTTSYSATFDTSSYSSADELATAIGNSSGDIKISISTSVSDDYLGKIANKLQSSSTVNCTLDLSESGITSIGAGTYTSVFANAYHLTGIILPSTLTTLGNYTFQNCTGLTSITLPSSLSSIGTKAFYGCSNLTSVVFSDTSKTWTANGTSISVTDASTNATNLTTTYAGYAWTAN